MIPNLSEPATVINLIEAIEAAAKAIAGATEEERAVLHPDLVEKADEIAAMLSIADAA